MRCADSLIAVEVDQFVQTFSMRVTQSNMPLCNMWGSRPLSYTYYPTSSIIYLLT